MEEKQAAALDCFAIIELFGHSRIAGKVRSENFGAACLIRVDVPAVTKKMRRVDYSTQEYYDEEVSIDAFTKFIGVGSIYALTPVTEELAKAAAKEIQSEPVSVFGLESLKRTRKELPPSDEVEEAEYSDEEVI
jgi:hypothetical protein